MRKTAVKAKPYENTQKDGLPSPECLALLDKLIEGVDGAHNDLMSKTLWSSFDAVRSTTGSELGKAYDKLGDALTIMRKARKRFTVKTEARTVRV